MNQQSKTMRAINTLRTENRKLFIELGKIPASSPDYEQNRKRIAAQVAANNREIEAFAKALGSNEEQSRLYRYRK